MHTCRICNSNEGFDKYDLREMYFGTREEFAYIQCRKCDCLQIAEIPDDLGKYYPDDYYSKKKPKIYNPNKLRYSLNRLRLNAALNRENVTNRIVSMILTKPRLPKWISLLDVHCDSKILDVGCGAGQTLHGFHRKGFTSLTGVDPFIESEIKGFKGLRIYKNQFWELRDSNVFDIITMHHSLEHVPEQKRVFETANKFLPINGQFLVRIPICSSWAWEHYRENWVQLDPPRHLYLHSLKSIKRIANETGFRLRKIHYDSSQFQFTGSEKYCRDIPLKARKDEELFTASELNDFDKRAQELNCQGKGDQASFLFIKEKGN